MPFTARPRFTWRLRTRKIALGERTIVMAILNVTPDSFSDGGVFFSTGRAVDQACTLLDQGAEILDLGGESTRPNATPLTAGQEQDRVLPVLAAILKERPQAVVSIDTYHAATAKAALALGAEIVNDVSGLLWDAAMPQTIAEARCGLVLMHTRGTPQEWPHLPALGTDEVMSTALAGLQGRLRAAQAAGIPAASIVLDPGFGFGKRGEENFVLQARFEQLHTLGLPLLAGTSRKSFLRQAVAERPPYPKTILPEARLAATTASNTAAILAGAHILRVHDVPAAVAAAAVADEILARV